MKIYKNKYKGSEKQQRDNDICVKEFRFVTP